VLLLKFSEEPGPYTNQCQFQKYKLVGSAYHGSKESIDANSRADEKAQGYCQYWEKAINKGKRDCSRTTKTDTNRTV